MLGGETSGHILSLDRTTTGDGLVTALQVLAIMKRTGRSLAELAAGMEKLPQVLLNVRGRAPLRSGRRAGHLGRRAAHRAAPGGRGAHRAARLGHRSGDPRDGRRPGCRRGARLRRRAGAGGAKRRPRPEGVSLPARYGAARLAGRSRAGEACHATQTRCGQLEDARLARRERARWSRRSWRAPTHCGGVECVDLSAVRVSGGDRAAAARHGRASSARRTCAPRRRAPIPARCRRRCSRTSAAST